MKTYSQTVTQQSLFNLDSQAAANVEEKLQGLPMHLRDELRRLYLREYKTVQDDKSIAYACKNKQRFAANSALRNALCRVKLARRNIRINFDAFQSFNLSQEFSELHQDAAQETDNEQDLFQNKEVTAAQRHALMLKKAKHYAGTPFYLLGEKGLKYLANSIADHFALFKRECLLNAAQQIQSDEGQIKFIYHYLRDRFPNLPTERHAEFLEKNHTVHAQLMQHLKDYIENAPTLCANAEIDCFIELGRIANECGLPFGNWESTERQYKKGKVKLQTARGFLARSEDHAYWLRRLKIAKNRAIENLRIACGQVQKNGATYISQMGFTNWQAQCKKNAEFLQQMVLVNAEDELDIKTLEELFFKSNANQAIRCAEMVNRIKGLDKFASKYGHQAYFLTLTAPSKYHAKLFTGADNPKWNGASPRATQEYLTKKWQEMRALWNKADIRFYGERVAEPHHDGTPHWHAIVFLRPEQAQEFIHIFKKKALEEDGNESGAKDHRCQVKKLDNDKDAGKSVVGYIIKYIAKNTTGFTGDKNLMATEPSGKLDITVKANALRARAWASLHGIRQFQFFGDKFIGIWRELRRLNQTNLADEYQENGETIERKSRLFQLWESADSGNYCAFLEDIAEDHTGPLAKREQMELQLNYAYTGEVNQYGEEKSRIDGLKVRFVGLSFDPAKDHQKTRFKRWKIQNKRFLSTEQEQALNAQNGELSNKNSARSAPWTCVNNCNGTKNRQKSQGWNISQNLDADIAKLPKFYPNTTPKRPIVDDYLAQLLNI